MDEKLRQTIIDHLLSRPIASIVVNSLEKDFDIALKVMCVIDYCVEKRDLYSDMNEIPKLLEQLLRFKSFGSFKFFEYKLKKSLLGNKLLQCTICEFIGPYITTLEHMVLSHNIHKSASKCQYCNTMRLRDHEQNRTLENCYMNYQLKQQIDCNRLWSPVISTFYSLIRSIAKKLGVHIQRGEYFKASADKRNENIVIEINDDDDDDDDDTDSSSRAFLQQTNHDVYTRKSIKLSVLDTMFQIAMQYFNISIQNICSISVRNDMTKNFAPSVSVNTISIDNEMPTHVIRVDHTIPNFPDRIPDSIYYDESLFNFYRPPSLPACTPLTEHSESSLPSSNAPATIPSQLPSSISAYSPMYTPMANINENISPVKESNELCSPIYTPSTKINEGLTPPNAALSPMHTSPTNINESHSSSNQTIPTIIRPTYSGQENNHINEISNFTNFIASTLNNMKNDSIRRKAQFQIQDVILRLASEDMKLYYQISG